MILSLRSILLAATLSFTALLLPGCDRKEEADADAPRVQYSGKDKVRSEVDAFLFKTRSYYNSSNFKALENSMKEIREGEPVFANGSWKIFNFYDSLECADSEKEGMWQLHERIHKAWLATYPDSITARIAYADFLVDYAWHARGYDYANTVTEEGWRLMKERLAAAQRVLDEAKPMKPQCPMWWQVQLHIALGQDWNHADYGRVYNEAKSLFPKFWAYDCSLAHYLLPRWHGQPGDWEKAAAAGMQRPDGLGAEVYARVVASQLGYYDNVFKETQASWPHTRDGMEVMRQKYPESLQILNQYCKLAYLAGDRAKAQELYGQLKGYKDERVWDGEDYANFQTWVNAH